MLKCAIFDLDGTLLNTIEDLAIATNYALRENGFPEHEVEAYKKFVGDGVFKLVERALPKDKGEDKNLVSKVLKSFDEYYKEHMLDKTKPYENMEKVLDALKEKGISLAVVSNKPDEFAGDIVRRFFGDRFDIIFGHRKGYLTKPDPASVNEVINYLKVSKEETIYIGDSNVDIKTAKNAKVKSIGVTWGFRGEKELVEEGADFIARKPEDILNIVIK